MQAECSAKASAFAPVEGRQVIAEFDGGAVTSDAGGLLLGAADKAIGLVRRLAGRFRDARDPDISNIRSPRWLANACSASRWDMRISTTTTICASIR